MADAKISALTALTAVVGTEQIPVNSSGTTKRTTATILRTFTSRWQVQANLDADSPVDVLVQQTEAILTNTGAGGTVQLLLPATPTLGTVLDFSVTAAQTLQVVASGSQVIAVGAAVSSAGGTFTSLTLHSHLSLRYVATDLWHGTLSGTWIAA